MPRVNKSQFGILGCLSIKPMSAYEIKSFINRSIAHFWSESEGQLYPTLRKLSDEGMVIGAEEISQKLKTKIVYSITKSGKKALKQWLAAEVNNIPYRNEILLKVFFGSEVKEETTIKLLHQSLDSLKQRLQQLENVKASLATKSISKKRKKYVFLSLEYGLRLLRAEKKWYEFAIQELKTDLL